MVTVDNNVCTCSNNGSCFIILLRTIAAATPLFLSSSLSWSSPSLSSSLSSSSSSSSSSSLSSSSSSSLTLSSPSLSFSLRLSPLSSLLSQCSHYNHIYRFLLSYSCILSSRVNKSIHHVEFLLLLSLLH